MADTWSGIKVLLDTSPTSLTHRRRYSIYSVGPISVAVYVKHEKDLHHITELRDKSASVSSFVDFHVLFANKVCHLLIKLLQLYLPRTNLV